MHLRNQVIGGLAAAAFLAWASANVLRHLQFPSSSGRSSMKRILVLMAIIGLWPTTSNLLAQNVFIGPVNGDYSTASNWSNGWVPQNGETAVITGTSSATLSSTVSAATNSPEVLGILSSSTTTTASLTLSSPSAYLKVNNTLGVAADASAVGNSIGLLTINGGTLEQVIGSTILSGGPNTSGTISVSGSGSTLLCSNLNGINLGGNSSATISVSNNGSIHASGAFQMGSESTNWGGTSTVSVTSGGSLSSNSNMKFGASGNATITLDNALISAGTYTATNGSGYSSLGTKYGNATMTMTNNAVYQVGSVLYVGSHKANADGVLNATNSRISTMAVKLSYGGSGYGELKMSGGTLEIGRDIEAHGGGGTGPYLFQLDGTLVRKWNMTGDNAAGTAWKANATIGSNGVTINTDATGILNSSGGPAVPVITVTGVLTGSRGLTQIGPGTLKLIPTSGTNNYSGRTAVAGDTIELGANAQQQVLSGGGADIQGTTGAKLMFDYSGASPVSTILSLLAASYATNWTSGQFISSDIASGVGLCASDNGTNVVSVFKALYADTNLDGTVNNTDYVTMMGNYGTASGASWADGDTDFDGDIDGADFLTWQRQFGRSINSIMAAQAIPEPASIGLVLSGLIGLALASRPRPQL
jgi:hypothetical protein